MDLKNRKIWCVFLVSLVADGASWVCSGLLIRKWWSIYPPEHPLKYGKLVLEDLLDYPVLIYDKTFWSWTFYRLFKTKPSNDLSLLNLRMKMPSLPLLQRLLGLVLFACRIITGIWWLEILHLCVNTYHTVYMASHLKNMPIDDAYCS